MFPSSPDPRAKINMTLGQLPASPSSSSVRVMVALRVDKGAAQATDAATASVLRILLALIVAAGLGWDLFRWVCKRWSSGQDKWMVGWVIGLGIFTRLERNGLRGRESEKGSNRCPPLWPTELNTNKH